MIGRKIAHYEIRGSLGKGGMGEVWLAHDTTLERDVAIKLLPESFASDANRVARFEQEAKMLAALNHPNIAQIFGLERGAEAAAESGAGGHSIALVMELVEGPTLADRIAQGAVPVDETLNIALQIAAALEAAHGQGIVHRDLKPANIKLKPDGTVKVLDFGIAKAIEMRATSGGRAAVLTTPSMTEAGVVLGTAAYMSPEQARGKPVDKRADVWAFGCLLYEMLTGQGAFIGEDVTTTLARVIERDPDLRSLPADLAPGIRGTLELCLQKDADKRLHDIGDVRLALVGGLAALAPADRAALHGSLGRQLWPAAAAALAAVLITLVATRFFPGETPVPISAITAPERAVSRFTITPPDDAPLASLGGYDVTISPDGRRIAWFAQDPRRGSVELYVRDLDALEARRVPGTQVTNTSGGNMNPFFSPDGRSIGFFTPDRGVVRVSIDGAPPTKILDPPTPAFLGATWADDNTLIYSPGRSIQRVATDGSGTLEAVTPDFDTNTFIASPVLLPGGNAVLFGEIVDGIESVAVIDLASGEHKTLIDGAQNAVYSPSGHIVYARGTTLMAAPFDVSELALTGESVAMVQNVRHPNSLTAADYALSDNGTLVYVPGSGSSGGLSNIYWVDRNGDTVGAPVAENLDSPRDPRLSPDGRQLLLTLGPAGDGDLWRYDLGGRPPVPLALGGDSRLGIWSPDGLRIAYTEVRDGVPDVRTIAADGSELMPRSLRPDGLAAAPVVWTQSNELILIRNPSSPDILATPAAPNGEVVVIVGSEYTEYDPALSPDGRWLAYVSDRSGTPEVWVQTYPAGAPIRVSATGGWEPHWSADGTELYFLQGNTVWATAVDIANGFSFEQPEALFNRPFSTIIAANAHSWDVAADGRFLMIHPVGSELASSGSESIVVVQNWTEELARRVPSGQ